MARQMHIAKGDTVEVIGGDDKGKRGRVLKTLPRRVASSSRRSTS